jgi:hypothetical protein
MGHLYMSARGALQHRARARPSLTLEYQDVILLAHFQHGELPLPTGGTTRGVAPGRRGAAFGQHHTHQDAKGCTRRCAAKQVRDESRLDSLNHTRTLLALRPAGQNPFKIDR